MQAAYSIEVRSVKPAHSEENTATKLKHGQIETPVFHGRGLKCSGWMNG